MNEENVNVLIVDDSALIRSLLTDVLETNKRITVCGVARDPYEARDKIKELKPDVLTLDIEMPRMNGISFLKNLMRLRPMPVVMISTLTQEGAPATLEALECGAIDFVPKPKSEGEHGLANYAEEICAKVLAAARANIAAYAPYEQKYANSVVKNRVAQPSGRPRENFICAIGASTGGTEAIKDVISALPENCPPIVIAQHIPENFSASFARRVDGLSVVNVFEAEHKQLIVPGSVYIAPGHSHLTVYKRGGQYYCALDQGPLVNRHRPAVERLFDSVREACGANCLGIQLTGMGSDGAEALLRMRKTGAMTFAQDEATSVVWGMPGVAVQLKAAAQVLAISKIAKEIVTEYFK